MHIFFLILRDFFAVLGVIETLAACAIVHIAWRDARELTHD